MLTELPIKIPIEKITEFCQRNYISKLSLFGSVLRSDFTPESDVDILVEFMPDKCPGFLKLAGMEIELSEILGRKADLRMPEELSRYFRQQVLGSAKELYLEVK